MVTREMLEALAQLAPTTIQTHAHGEDAHTHRPEFDVVTYVEAHGANVKKTSQKGDWSVYDWKNAPLTIRTAEEKRSYPFIQAVRGPSSVTMIRVKAEIGVRSKNYGSQRDERTWGLTSRIMIRGGPVSWRMQ